MLILFLLSLTAFLISIGSGAYFLWWWIKSGRRYAILLYWAYGLGALLLFKVPNIIANAGVKIVQRDFYISFFATLLGYFLALFALRHGLSFFSDHSRGILINIFFKLWFGVAVAYLSLSFFAGGELSFAPVWGAHILFYIPAQLFLLRDLGRLAKKFPPSFVIPSLGKKLSIAGTILLVIISILYIGTQIFSHSREFWYFSVTASPVISLLQIISGILLFLGFRALARSYIERAC